MADSKTPLKPEGFYHIYNHAVGRELMFKSERNYQFFLMKFKKYLNGYINVYAYCLLPNHFHLLIKVKTEKEIHAIHYPTRVQNPIPTRVQNPRRDDPSINVIPLIISQRFSNMFNSYSQAFNRENYRKGSLFNNRFKRKQVEGDEYLCKLIHYIHHNPLKHGLEKRVDAWPYSSYSSILLSKDFFLNRPEVLDLFGGFKNFIYCHSTPSAISGLDY